MTFFCRRSSVWPNFDTWEFHRAFTAVSAMTIESCLKHFFRVVIRHLSNRWLKVTESNDKYFD